LYRSYLQGRRILQQENHNSKFQAKTNTSKNEHKEIFKNLLEQKKNEAINHFFEKSLLRESAEKKILLILAKRRKNLGVKNLYSKNLSPGSRNNVN